MRTLLLVAFALAPCLATAQDAEEDLVEGYVAAAAVESDPRVLYRIGELAASAAYEGHSFLRFKKDLSQVKKLKFYVDPETRAPVDRRDNLDAVKVVAERISVIVQNDGGYSWTGELREQNRNGEFLGEVFLYVADGAEVSGSIIITDEVFLVESVGDGVSMVVSVDEGQRGNPHGDIATAAGASEPSLMGPGAHQALEVAPEAPASASSSSYTPYVQRLLVLYTTGVQNLDNQSSYDFVSKIYQEEGRTNSAYAASDIDEFDIDVVGVRLYPSFEENGNLGDDLDDLRIDAGVRDLRDQYQADLVMIVVSSASDASGKAYLNVASQDLAFSAITWNGLFSTGNVDYIFAHEIGHNQGAEHHPNDGVFPYPQRAFEYSLGHRFRDRDCFIFCSGYSYYATIMAYAGVREGNTYSNIPRFSNPDVYYDDQRTGITNDRDNARTLENTAARIANLYQTRFSARISVSSASTPYPGTYTFAAVTSGTEGASSYEWYVSSSPTSYGGVKSTSRTHSQYLGGGTWYVKLVARSTFGTVRTAYRTVDVLSDGPPPGGGCEDPKAIDCPLLMTGPEVAEPLAVAPNPVGGAGRVAITLEESAVVDLTVYDALGRAVRTLASGTLEAGGHAFALDAAALPSGVYVARLSVDGSVSTRPFTVAR